MPIKPENRHKYPPQWKIIRRVALYRAMYTCQGTPQFPDCRAMNHGVHQKTGSRVVLTIAHMDNALRDHGFGNLRALCQRCHLAHDAMMRKMATKKPMKRL